MYQIVLRGYFETDKPDEFIDAIKNITEANNVELCGTFQVFQLAPYVDYQKADVIKTQD